MAEAPRVSHPELVDGFVKGRVSILMPAYNEADSICKGIAQVKRQFGAVCEDYEVIVVDDGSIDRTKNIVETLPDHELKLVSYPRNEGKGFAIRRGFSHVTGEFTFLVDSDAEIMSKDLAGYLKALQTAEIAIGSKRHPLSEVRTPVLRRFLSLGFNLLERLLTGVHATDTQAGLKAARSTALYRILPLLSVKKYAFDVELLTVASLLDLKINELPVIIDLKASFSARKVFRMLIDLLGIAYRLRVRGWYQANAVRLSDTYKPIITW